MCSIGLVGKTIESVTLEIKQLNSINWDDLSDWKDSAYTLTNSFHPDCVKMEIMWHNQWWHFTQWEATVHVLTRTVYVMTIWGTPHKLVLGLHFKIIISIYSGSRVLPRWAIEISWNYLKSDTRLWNRPTGEGDFVISLPYSMNWREAFWLIPCA